MNEKIKYLSLLVMLTFVVGQVQYAYATYFCTMKQMVVNSASIEMAATSSMGMTACDECAGTVQPKFAVQIVQGNCIQVQLAEKKIVDNFTDSGKYNLHPTASLVFIVVQDQCRQISRQNFIPVLRTDSPPLDIPTFQSNLRI